MLLSTMFVDEVKVRVRSGKGGHGVTAFARQPYEPRGRPDGGDGGRGGDVIVRGSPHIATLIDYHHRAYRTAANGVNGEGDLRRGADGRDEILLVPLGTVLRSADGSRVADLLHVGDEIVVVPGGRGGRGNAAFRTSRRRAPQFHEFGEPARECSIRLELKLVADVALLGYPNAGKSSIVARLSAARPKIADYPFTTLTPNLGVVRYDDIDFVVADVPGLIEGAAEGRGLGHRFLRHVERAGVFVHVLDCATWEQRDPLTDLQTVVDELGRYQRGVMEVADKLSIGEVPLQDRPTLVFLNKLDADREIAELVRPDLERDGWEVLQGSAVTGEGLDVLRRRMAELVVEVRRERAQRPAGAISRAVTRPVATRTGQDIAVTHMGGAWHVRGERVERWVAMTDFSNVEGVRYLQARLARAGVEQALADAGAQRGDPVEIAGAVFDFVPDLELDPEDQ